MLVQETLGSKKVLDSLKQGKESGSASAGETKEQRFHLLKCIKIRSRFKGNIFFYFGFVCKLLSYVCMLKVLVFALDCILHASFYP